jgi:hypothetical protein
MCAHRWAALLVLAVLPAIGAIACGDSPNARRDRAGSSASPARQPQFRSRPAEDGVAWTRDAVLRRLAGRRIRVGQRTVRIDGGTLACGGLGRATTRIGGEPAWTGFRCVQPTFPPGSVAGPDAIFVVAPTGPRTLVVTDRRLTGY